MARVRSRLRRAGEERLREPPGLLERDDPAGGQARALEPVVLVVGRGGSVRAISWSPVGGPPRSTNRALIAARTRASSMRRAMDREPTPSARRRRANPDPMQARPLAPSGGGRV